MSTVNNFVSDIPTYADLLETINAIHELLYNFQSEINVAIVRHVHPYVIEVSHFNGYFQIHIFTLQGLLHLYNTIDDMLLLTILILHNEYSSVHTTCYIGRI